MTCPYKENIYNTGEYVCQDDGNYYICQSDGTWKALGVSCVKAKIAGLIVYVPLFIMGSIITYKVGKWASRKIGLEK